MLINSKNPILKQKTNPVILEKELELIKELRKTLYIEDALGICANQIGECKNLFLALDPMSDEAIVFANSKIIETSKTTEFLKEGCLSFPNLILNIKRPTNVRIKYQTLIGDEILEKEDEFGGLLARIILHEYDHTQGVVFTQRYWRKF